MTQPGLWACDSKTKLFQLTAIPRRTALGSIIWNGVINLNQQYFYYTDLRKHAIRGISCLLPSRTNIA